VILTLLGLPWIIGYFMIDNQKTLIFSYLFTIINSSQGTIVFIFHCIVSKSVRDELLKVLHHSRYNIFSTIKGGRDGYFNYYSSSSSKSPPNGLNKGQQHQHQQQQCSTKMKNENQKQNKTKTNSLSIEKRPKHNTNSTLKSDIYNNNNNSHSGQTSSLFNAKKRTASKNKKTFFDFVLNIFRHNASKSHSKLSSFSSTSSNSQDDKLADGSVLSGMCAAYSQNPHKYFYNSMLKTNDQQATEKNGKHLETSSSGNESPQSSQSTNVGQYSLTSSSPTNTDNSIISLINSRQSKEQKYFSTLKNQPKVNIIPSSSSSIVSSASFYNSTNPKRQQQIPQMYFTGETINESENIQKNNNYIGYPIINSASYFEPISKQLVPTNPPPMCPSELQQQQQQPYLPFTDLQIYGPIHDFHHNYNVVSATKNESIQRTSPPTKDTSIIQVGKKSIEPPPDQNINTGFSTFKSAKNQKKTNDDKLMNKKNSILPDEHVYLMPECQNYHDGEIASFYCEDGSCINVNQGMCDDNLSNNYVEVLDEFIDELDFNFINNETNDLRRLANTIANSTFNKQIIQEKVNNELNSGSRGDRKLSIDSSINNNNILNESLLMLRNNQKNLVKTGRMTTKMDVLNKLNQCRPSLSDSIISNGSGTSASSAISSSAGSSTYLTSISNVKK
jgi:hypothetical protein